MMNFMREKKVYLKLDNVIYFSPSSDKCSSSVLTNVWSKSIVYELASRGLKLEFSQPKCFYYWHLHSCALEIPLTTKIRVWTLCLLLQVRAYTTPS